jgi:hypothetical protein
VADLSGLGGFKIQKEGSGQQSIDVGHRSASPLDLRECRFSPKRGSATISFFFPIPCPALRFSSGLPEN